MLIKIPGGHIHNKTSGMLACLRTGFVVLVFFWLISLRFLNLGYSEYGPDETTVMGPLKDTGYFSLQTLSEQRKGPMQFWVASAVNLFGADVHDEFLYRIPFALASSLGLAFFYLAIKNLSGSGVAALTSTIVLGLNGFIVAFGRIVQYQSLNMMFSFLAIYLLTLPLKLNYSQKKHIQVVTGSLVAFFFSLASHWDAVFTLPVLLLLIYRNKVRYAASGYDLKRFYLTVGYTVLVTVVPFLLGFWLINMKTQGNLEYFGSRMGTVSVSVDSLAKRFDEYIYRSRVYFPFIYLEFVSITALMSLVAIRKSRIVWVWALSVILFFLILISKPGTHIYNIFIPLSILSGYGISAIITVFKKHFVIIPVLLLSPVFMFFYYQNYLLFADSKVEYPWDRELIYKWKTGSYSQKTLSNNILGFPMRRNWETINNIVSTDLASREGNYTFITNEVRSISSFYMDIPHGHSERMYGIGIKNPFSFESDYTFPQYHNRNTIDKVYYDGMNTARIYIIDQKAGNQK